MSLLSAREAAKYLNISLATLYRIERKGKLTPFRTAGRHRRYNLAMLNEYLESSRQSLPAMSSPKHVENVPEDKLPAGAVRILVVDYRPDTVESIIKALREDSEVYEFASASTGYEVGVQVMAFKPALIVLGMVRPEANGCEVCEKIKSDPETEHIRIVGVVGSGENGIVKELLRCGIDDCLIKPLQIEELQRSVRYLISRKTGVSHVPRQMLG